MEELTSQIIAELLLSPDIAIEYFKNSQHAVVVVDNKAVIRYTNRSAELLFGYHTSELKGQQIEILLPDSLKEKHIKHRDGFINHPRNRPMGMGIELKAKHKDGHEISIDINLIPVPTATEFGTITIAEISRK
jgi:PAS domain S-box-containing protein